MKKVLDLICVIMFFTIVVMFALSMLIFNGSGNIFKGQEGQSVDEQLSQNFPLKENWKTLRTSLLLAAGKTEIDGTFLIDGAVIKPSEQVSDEATKRLSEGINTFCEKYSGKSVYACIIPSPSGIYSADIPSVGVGFDQRHYIDDVYYSLDSSVVTLDAYSPLYTSRENYIYMRTDESLTSAGAFSVYSSVVRKMGFSPRPLSDYDTEHAMSGFIGSLCTELKIRQRITPDNIDLLTPKNGTVVTSAIGTNGNSEEAYKSVFDRGALLGESPLDVFVYGDRFEKVDIKTINSQNPKLLIIKTAHTNPVIPFIISHYSFVTVIDADKASGRRLSELAAAENYDQVLFLLDIESLEGLRLDEMI